ncbi:MAG: glycosyltransferase family 2 protein [Promethearchaeota archaeon]
MIVLVNILSIIIVNYNYTTSDLKKCLISLSNQVFKKFEILIVDNNSKRKFVENLKKFIKTSNEIQSIKDKIQLLELKKNLGYTGGNNHGIKKSRGDVILLLNPDISAGSYFLQKMVSLFEKYPRLHIAQPQINWYNNKNRIQSRGGIINPARIDDIHHLFYNREGKKENLNKCYKIDFAYGCAFFIRRDVLSKVGLLDNIFFMYNEEADLCLRARRSGFSNIYCYTGVKVYHNSSIDITPTFKKFKFRNNIILYLKNYSYPIIISRLFIQFLQLLILSINFKKMKIDVELLKFSVRKMIEGYIIGIKRRCRS